MDCSEEVLLRQSVANLSVHTFEVFCQHCILLVKDSSWMLMLRDSFSELIKNGLSISQICSFSSIEFYSQEPSLFPFESEMGLNNRRQTKILDFAQNEVNTIEWSSRNQFLIMEKNNQIYQKGDFLELRLTLFNWVVDIFLWCSFYQWIVIRNKTRFMDLLICFANVLGWMYLVRNKDVQVVSKKMKMTYFGDSVHS
jgi:hypothetical protein